MIDLTFLKSVEIWLPLILCLPGALVFRARGGKPNIPRPIEQAVYSLPFAFIAYIGTPQMIILGLQLIYEFGYYREALTLVVWALTTVMVLKGHGRNMDLGTYEKPAEPEWYEFVIRKLEKKLSQYWYDVVGITLSGITYAIPLTIVTLNPLCLLAGAMKGPAYMIGWKFFKRKQTEVGEYLTGAFQWAALGLLMSLYI